MVTFDRGARLDVWKNCRWYCVMRWFFFAVITWANGAAWWSKARPKIAENKKRILGSSRICWFTAICRGERKNQSRSYLPLGVCLLQRRSQLRVLVFLAVPVEHGGRIFTFPGFLHVDAEHGSLLQCQALHGESFERHIDQKELGLRLFRVPRVLLVTVNDQEAEAAPLRF